MRVLLAVLLGTGLAAEAPGLFTLRDSLEHCEKMAYLTPAAEEAVFVGEKSFAAEPMQAGMAAAIKLTFLNGKLAKIVWTFKPEVSTAKNWKLMIDLRRKQHDSLDTCYGAGKDCWEWAGPDIAERLIYDPDKPAITSTLIDRDAYKKAVSKKRKPRP
ncbi:MAG: hypothetical protein HY077_05000 [Elusimicrobia bacterium]|nr:hypothetical protein [Elusimicrobiota bacterium]